MEYLDRNAAFAHQSDDSGATARQRDRLITLLAACHLISGCWRLYQENRIFLTYLDLAAVDDPDVALWGPPVPLIALANVTVFFIIASGVGLWLNTKWGWWIASFVYGYAVVRSIYMLGMWFVRSDAFHEQEVEFDLKPYIRNLGIYSVLFAYLQTNRVLTSFGLPPTRPFRRKSIVALFGAAIAGVIVTTLLSLFILTTFGRSVPYIEVPR